jgi:hypothetical protein
MRQTGILLICVAIILLGPACVVAATMTVPLSPVVTAGPHGDYLSAEFDFGTKFADIDSVTLEFTLPNGYQGFIATTGNSISSRNIDLVLHDLGTSAADPNPTDTRFGRRQSLLNISAASPYSFQFKDLTDFGNPLFAGIAWPDFVLQGRGQVSLIDIFVVSSQPLLQEAGSISTTSWSPPSGMSGLSLTIVGTLVPEPNSVLICLFGVASLAMFRRRHRSTLTC